MHREVLNFNYVMSHLEKAMVDNGRNMYWNLLSILVYSTSYVSTDSFLFPTVPRGNKDSALSQGTGKIRKTTESQGPPTTGLNFHLFADRNERSSSQFNGNN